MNFPDQEVMRRIVTNLVVVMIAAALTAGFQFLSTIDFGSWSPFITALTATAVKGVQVWAETAGFKNK